MKGVQGKQSIMDVRVDRKLRLPRSLSGIMRQVRGKPRDARQ